MDIIEDNYLQFIASAAFLLWSFFKGTDWYIQKKNERREKIIKALEAGVMLAWEEVVKPWLKEKESTCRKQKKKVDKKLSPEVKQIAEKTAIEHATKINKSITGLSKEELHVMIKKLVDESKAKNKK